MAFYDTLTVLDKGSRPETSSAEQLAIKMSQPIALAH
jgi:hypothetical protein